MVLLAATLVALVCRPVAAQGDLGDGPGADGLGGEIELRIDRVGPGGRARLGEWTGVRVRVLDRGVAPSRTVLLRIEGADRDGDIPVYERAISTTSGQETAFWLYLRVPFAIDAIENLEVTAIEAEEAGPEDPIGFRPGSRVLGKVIQPWQMDLDRSETRMIGVLADAELQLDQYQANLGGAGGDVSLLGHEYTRVLSMAVSDVPDRWHGLAAMEAIVWGSGRRADPADLTPTQATALREWVTRGGHLVVVLPSFGSSWTTPGANTLTPILPDIAAPERREGVDLEPYRGLLTWAEASERPLPEDAVLHTFVPADGAAATDAIPILNGPDGETLVIRRLIGSGAVTLVGLDLSAAALRRDLPRVEQFWHRVLGRRGLFPVTNEEREAIFGAGNGIPTSNREVRSFDRDIADAIDRTGKASGGVLLGLFVFVLYWLVAGPVGYAMLRATDRKQHAWLAFAAAVGVFTAVAWAGAWVIKPKAVDAQHIGLVEQVHGQPTQRSRAWANVLVPYYGDAAFAINGDDGPRVTGPNWTNLITAWEPPGQTGIIGGFPDNRVYRIDARAPSKLRMPVRATVKQVRVDWAGEATLGMPAPIGEPGDLTPPLLGLTDDGNRLAGVLAHALPGALRDVTIIWVPGQSSVRAVSRGSQSIAPSAKIVSLANDRVWMPGERLDLAELTADLTPGELSIGRYLAVGRFVGRASGAFTGPVGDRTADGSLRDRLLRVGLLGQAEPPGMLAATQNWPMGQRTSTQGWDLGVWFTQPCIIVLGILETDDGARGLPFSLTVDGEAVETRGWSVVRWVYPLTGAPPPVDFDASATGETDGSGEG